MKQSDPTHALSGGPVVTAYFVIGFSSLTLLGLALLRTGSDRWALVPTLIGTAGMVFRWRIAPLALIAAVAFGIIMPSWTGGALQFRRINTLLIDVVLCGSILVYLIAQYRLTGIQSAILPPDPRTTGEPLTVRDPSTISAREAPTAMIVAIAGTVGSFFVWEMTSLVRPMWGIAPSYWRVALLIWIIGLLLVGLGATIGYLGWRRQSPTEAKMFLRDEYWRQTRGEQRRINRWRAWARRARN